MENRRCAGGKIIQRPVLYLGEINVSGARKEERSSFDSCRSAASAAWQQQAIISNVEDLMEL